MICPILGILTVLAFVSHSMRSRPDKFNPSTRRILDLTVFAFCSGAWGIANLISPMESSTFGERNVKIFAILCLMFSACCIARALVLFRRRD